MLPEPFLPPDIHRSTDQQDIGPREVLVLLWERFGQFIETRVRSWKRIAFRSAVPRPENFARFEPHRGYFRCP
jgi:hypothetical protein